MSTQLYSSWLATTQPQCYLQFSLPPKVNLPPEYQPNLDHRLRELTVDFSLEESILTKAQNSVETDISENSTYRTLGPNSLLQPEVVNQARSVQVKESAPKIIPEVKSENVSQVNNNQTNLDPLLNQFDTLNVQPEPPSDDIKQQLAELFSTSVKSLSPHSPNRSPQTAPQGMVIPPYSRREFRHNSPGPPSDLYSSLPSHLSYSKPVTFQKPYSGFYPATGPSSTNENLNSGNGLNKNEAPPLPPPNPLPKPSDLNNSGSSDMNSDIDASLSQLVSMGFSQQSALQALQKNNGNLDQAIEALLSGQF